MSLASFNFRALLRRARPAAMQRAIPSLTQTANAAPVSPASLAFGDNGY